MPNICEEKKCSWGDGASVEILGHEVDPCVYQEVETHRGVTVHVLKCKKCGHVEITWEPSYEEGEDGQTD